MNWLDFVLIALLLTAVVIGAKKGLVRELSALLLFLVTGVTSLTYLDTFAVWVYEQIGGSPMISAFLSFLVLLAISYTVFKLAGFIFYKVASIKSLGKQDQMGGALVGFVRGWLGVAFLVFMAFLLPMPEKFYSAFETSAFGPVLAKTVPLVYESTTVVHPQSPSFVDKVKEALLDVPGSSSTGKGGISEDRAETFRAMHRIEQHFTLEKNKAN